VHKFIAEQNTQWQNAIKIQKVIAFFSVSPKRACELAEMQQNVGKRCKELVSACPTWWHTKLKMIQAYDYCEDELWKLSQVSRDENDNSPQRTKELVRLSHSGVSLTWSLAAWEHDCLHQIIPILKLFKTSTEQLLSASKPTLGLILPVSRQLQNQLIGAEHKLTNSQNHLAAEFVSSLCVCTYFSSWSGFFDFEMASLAHSWIHGYRVWLFFVGKLNMDTTTHSSMTSKINSPMYYFSPLFFFLMCSHRN